MSLKHKHMVLSCSADPMQNAAQRPQIIACQSEPSCAARIQRMRDFLAMDGNDDTDAVAIRNDFGYGAMHITREPAFSGAPILMDEAVHDEAISILEEYNAAGAQQILLNGNNGDRFTGADGGLHAVAVNHGGYGIALLQECRDDIAVSLHGIGFRFDFWCSHVAMAA